MLLFRKPVTFNLNIDNPEHPFVSFIITTDNKEDRTDVFIDMRTMLLVAAEHGVKKYKFSKKLYFFNIQCITGKTKTGFKIDFRSRSLI